LIVIANIYPNILQVRPTDGPKLGNGVRMGFEKTMVAFLEHIKKIPASRPIQACPAAALRALLVKAGGVFIAARFGSSLIADAGPSALLRPGC